MSFQDLASCVEILESDMATAYPGLPPHAYQSIALESQNRSNGGAGGREWAMNTCRCAWLDMKRENQQPADDKKEEDYFS